MDPLCHTLVGAVIAETGLKRRTGRGMATLLIAANLPDIDAIAAFTERGLAIRRGVTHGLPALILLPLLLTVTMVLWDRVRRRGRDEPPVVPGQLLLLACVGVWTHPTLDWMNTYGLRWLMPMDGTWFYGDALFIVDPWLLLLLGAGVLVARRRSLPAAGSLALALAALYIVGMVGLTRVGRAVVREQLAMSASGPRDLLVAPEFGVPWRRTVLVVEPDQYRFGEIEWLPRPVVRLAGTITRGREMGDEVRRSGSPAVQAFLGWARFPFYRREGSWIVADDARYSRGGGSFARVTTPATSP